MALEAPVSHPASWPVVQLASVTRKIGSGATPTGGEINYLPTRLQFALVRSPNVFDRFFDVDGLAFISNEQAERLNGVKLHPGDILLNITGDGATFGRACMVHRDALPACVNQHVSIIRTDPAYLDPGYLLAFLTHPTTKNYIESFNAGGSRRAITKGHIDSFCIPLPPLAEQHAIASVLGSLDDKIELNRRMSETLEMIARALFKSWFVDFDPVRAKLNGRAPAGMDAETAALFPGRFEDYDGFNVPDGWQIRSLYGSATYINGAAYRDFHFTTERGSLPVIKIAELKAGVTRQTKFTNTVVAEKHRINNADILFSWSGNPDTSIDTFVWHRGPGWLNQHIFKVVPHHDNQRLFVLYLLKWLRPQFAEIARNKQTTGLGHVTAEDMRRMNVVAPPDTVLDAFNAIAGPVYQRWYATLHESETLAALRNFLLPRLLSGELRVKDAEKLAEAAL